METDRLLDQLDALAPLGELPRTGWVVRGCLPAETIAAHTLQVALLVAALVDALRAAGKPVDGELALRPGLAGTAPAGLVWWAPWAAAPVAGARRAVITARARC